LQTPQHFPHTSILSWLNEFTYVEPTSPVYWSQTPCLACLATGSWQSPAQDLNIFKSARGTHFAKLKH
jgi:hypothetical protein